MDFSCPIIRDPYYPYIRIQCYTNKRTLPVVAVKVVRWAFFIFDLNIMAAIATENVQGHLFIKPHIRASVKSMMLNLHIYKDRKI